ncbi:MAG: Imm1 family immunity protein [Micromonosporaceae bacterium]
MTTVAAYFRHEHGEAPVRVSTPDEMDALIDELLEEPYDNSVAALYVEGRRNEAAFPDHELLLAVSQEDSVGGLRYMGGDGAYTAKGSPSRYEEVMYYYMGHDREFPRDSELPLDVIRRAAKEFLTGGGDRPTCVEWADVDTPVSESES